MSSPFTERLRSIAARDAGRVAVADDAGTLTYGRLYEATTRVAASLSARGLTGARAGLLLAPGRDWVTAFAGCLAGGVTAVALGELYSERELGDLLLASRAQAVVVSAGREEVARRVAGAWVEVLRLEELTGGGGVPAGAARGSFGVSEGAVQREALVLFTSGTTGRAKGVPISEASVVGLGDVLARAWGFGPDDVLLHVLPLHHLHGIGVSLVVSLLAGGTARFLPRFDAERTWDALGSATALMGVPTQHKKLFDAFDAAPAERRAEWARSAKRLRLVTSGSAALPAALGERWRSLAGQYPLERYGMTEIGIVLSNPENGERRPGTVGLPLPGVELRIVDDDGNPAAEGEPGEMWVRAPSVFAGYDEDAAATRASFRDGWFVTGDTARRGPDGYVTILGRTSVDILKSGGEKLSALEIEDALREHPDVAEVAVVGLPDETWGEAVVAVVVARAGRAEGLAEPLVRAWAKERLTAYKVPKRVLVVDELPRNPLGKVMKGELVRRLRLHVITEIPIASMDSKH
ncbi:MAG TPA: AMP-binding protein [Polyangiaceae bacterium]|jgi:malonyl-CoA/methylmalonyl-CoA synthetase|nr:AMP-binding protein [Polyangiaceae bacterium]